MVAAVVSTGADTDGGAGRLHGGGERDGVTGVAQDPEVDGAEVARDARVCWSSSQPPATTTVHDEHVGHAEPLAPRSGEESEECEGRGKNELRSREQPISGFFNWGG